MSPTARIIIGSVIIGAFVLAGVLMALDTKRTTEREPPGVSYTGWTDPMDDSPSGLAFTTSENKTAELVWRCDDEDQVVVILRSQMPIRDIERSGVSVRFRFDSLPASEPERFAADYENVYLYRRAKVDSFTATAMRSERVLIEVPGRLWLFHLARLDAAVDSLPCT